MFFCLKSKKGVVAKEALLILSALFFMLFVINQVVLHNKTQILMIIGVIFFFGVLLFSEMKRLIFFTFLCLLLGTSRYESSALFAQTLRWLLLGAICVQTFAKSVGERMPARSLRAVDLLALAFISLAFFSTLYSIAPRLTFERSASLVLMYGAVFWGIWQYVDSKEKLYSIIHLILNVSAAVFAIGLVLPGGSGAERFTGVMWNPNAVGVLSGIVLPLAMWRYVTMETHKRWNLALIAVIVLNLIRSGSRGGFLSAMVGCGYFFFYRFRGKRVTYAYLLTLITLIGIGIIELFRLTQPLASSLRLETFSTGSFRTIMWQEIIKLIEKRPLLGYGFGTEDKIMEYFGILIREFPGFYVHNSYIGLTAQLGLIGSCLMFLPLIVLVVNQIRRIYLLEKGEQMWVSVALVGSILGSLTSAFFESWIYSVGNAFALPFWTVVMLTMRIAALQPAPVAETTEAVEEVVETKT